MIETNFKHTEIGLIPHDWEMKTIKEFADITTGSQNTQDHVDDGKYPFFVRSPKVERINKYIFDTEGVVTAGDGVGTGKIYHYINGKFGLHQRCYLMYNFADVSAKYFYWIFSRNFYDRVQSMTAKSSVDSVRMEMIADMSIPLPPTLAEQERIAGALSSIDTLIGALNEQIEKKRHIKQGTMQQLLTGKKRLEGFTGEWKNVRLGEIGVTYSGLSGKTAVDFGKGQAQYITFLNILNNPIIDTSIFERVQVRPNERQNAVHIGDLFFNTSSETPDEVGICAVILEEIENLYLNSFCFGYRLIDETIDGKYLAYYFRSKEGRELMTTLAQGATRYNLSKSSFCKAEITTPPTIAEQSAIAAVLSGMYTEIAALEQKRDKYIAIKSGMMQQLLTGRIRLLEEETQEKPIVQTIQPLQKQRTANVFFRRSVLAAEIADRLCEKRRFGHVKMEKLIFMTEKMCGIDLASHYHRDAAGPYDNRALRSIDSQLKKQKWFEAKSITDENGNRRYTYMPLANRGGHKQYFDLYYADVLPEFDNVINTMADWDTEHCEIIATLYSAWEDLLHSGNAFTDDDILNELYHRWHDSKKRFSAPRLLSALTWMRQNNFIPKK